MDNLVRRGVSHIIKKLPTKEPSNLTHYQQLYYKKLTGENITDDVFNNILNDTHEITSNDELWLAIIFRKRNCIKQFTEKGNRDKVKNYAIDNDVLEFLSLHEAINLMIQRCEEEKAYFKIVKEYYMTVVKLTKQMHSTLFFMLNKDQLKFLRTELHIEVAEYELSPVAYNVYLDNDYSVLGLHPSLHNCKDLVYYKLLELSDNIEEFFNKLRKHTEIFLNSMDLKFVNAVIDVCVDGNTEAMEVVDFPWFMLKFEHITDDFVKIVLCDGAKSYSKVYKSEIKYTILNEGDKKYVQIRDYPVIQIDDSISDHEKRLLEHFGVNKNI